MDFINLMHTGNPKSQNQINTSVIFNYVQKNGPTYKSQIADALAISLPAVSRVIDALEESGFIEKAGTNRSASGRPVEFYRAAVRDGFVIGIDLLKHRLAIKSLGATKDIYVYVIDIDATSVEESVGLQIQKTLESALAMGRIKDPAGLKAICIGSPGIVDYATGEIKTAVFHRELNAVNLKASLSARFGVPVFVDNVVNLSAFAEFRNMETETPQNLLCLDIGFEVGAGLIINGSVFRGSHSTAGEIGFITRSYDEWGNPDALNARSASFIWLCAQARDALGVDSRYDDYSCRDENLKVVVSLFEMARGGRPEAQDIVTAYLKRLAVLINSMQLLLDPDVVVLSGDICLVAGFKEVFLRRLNELLDGISRFEFQDVLLSEYGTDSALFGACEHASESYIKEAFPYIRG